jgi:hypothetical protein
MASNISHSELCIATARRFIGKVALYEYKGFITREEPDVLVFDDGGTTLYEIKVSLSDFNADKYKECRKKYRLPAWAYPLSLSNSDPVKLKNEVEHARKHMRLENKVRGNNNTVRFDMIKGKPEIALVEQEHLGKFRYFVCPDGIIPIEKLPDGWGLYYFKNGRFYHKRSSQIFRPNIRKELDILTHALRRYASGDNTGILVNTYGEKHEK